MQTSYSQNPRIMRWSLVLWSIYEGPKTWLQITSVVQTEMITVHVVHCDVWSQCKYVVLLLHYSLYYTVNDMNMMWHYKCHVRDVKCCLITQCWIYVYKMSKKIIHYIIYIYTWCLKKYTLSDNMCLVYISAIVMLTVMCADRIYMQS